MVCPVIDVIDWNTFQYLGHAGEPQIGGFDWRLVFTWHTIPDYEQKRRRSPVDVIRCVLRTLYYPKIEKKSHMSIWECNFECGSYIITETTLLTYHTFFFILR